MRINHEPVSISTKMKVVLFCVTIYLSLVSLGCNKVDSNPIKTVQNMTEEIEYVGPCPTRAQLEYQQNEITLFIRFGIPTFNTVYPGMGTEPAEVFNPSNVKVEQWVEVAKKYGIKRLILSTKTIEGFCLWPSDLTSYSVKKSSYLGGKSDVVKNLSELCKVNGIKFGIAQSPIDLNSPYFGKELYNDYFINQLNELLTRYGDIADIYFEDPVDAGISFTQSFDWNRYYTYIRLAQPYSLVLGMGPDISVYQGPDRISLTFNSSIQMSDVNRHGFTGVKVWDPKSVSMSISDTWFKTLNSTPIIKTGQELFSNYLSTVGKNCNLILSVSPGTDGEISSEILNSLEDFSLLKRKLFDEGKVFPLNVSGSFRDNNNAFSPNNLIDGNEVTFWTTNTNTTTSSVVFNFGKLETIDCIRLKEAIKYGERITSYSAYFLDTLGQWKLFYTGTGIGNNMIIDFNTISALSIKLVFNSDSGSPALCDVEFFHKAN